MTKKLASLLLTLVMCLTLCVPAFAAAPQNGTENAPADRAYDVAAPRLGPTTTTIRLSTSWKDLVTDNNKLTEKFTVEMPLENPGGCVFRIQVTDNNNETSTLETSGNVNNGSTWISGDISWTYKSYTVQVKAITTTGSYTFTYYD